jgi:hypothetical protein
VRRISFSLTERQFLAGHKTVTRRLGWRKLMPGDRLLGVRKAMGLKKGEKQVVLGELEVIRVELEPLHSIHQYDDDCAKEGFPHLSPVEFVRFFCKSMNCKPETVVTRIEFRRVS